MLWNLVEAAGISTIFVSTDMINRLRTVLPAYDARNIRSLQQVATSLSKKRIQICCSLKKPSSFFEIQQLASNVGRGRLLSLSQVNVWGIGDGGGL